MNSQTNPPNYEVWTRLPVHYLPVTLGDQLVGYLWGSENGKAAGFLPHLAIDINRVKSSIYWYNKLADSYGLGLTAVEAIRQQIGGAIDPQFGGVAADAEQADASTIQELALRLNPEAPLGKGPWVQDGTFPSGAPEDRSQGWGPLVSAPTTTYNPDTVSAVTFLPVTLNGTVVGYVWASDTEDDAAGYLPRSGIGRASMVAGGLWRSRLISAHMAGLPALEALRQCRALPAHAAGTFGVIEQSTPNQHAASLSALRQLAEQA
ncbi:hypothetical protein [Nocardia sp. NBC_01327]|uniref:hypothetical protein n=1 Tax=Nocardia sp. NBC_01327 TaxID=2903593 RepID=UPI002E10355B|nr:hypothetical protein OG326_06735 [Nocardia sp. NBC_01327]